MTHFLLALGMRLNKMIIFPIRLISSLRQTLIKSHPQVLFSVMTEIDPRLLGKEVLEKDKIVITEFRGMFHKPRITYFSFEKILEFPR